MPKGTISRQDIRQSCRRPRPTGPLFGVSVNIVGTSLGAIANENGEYTIARSNRARTILRFTMTRLHDTLQDKCARSAAASRASEASVRLETEPVQTRASRSRQRNPTSKKILRPRFQGAPLTRAGNHKRRRFVSGHTAGGSSAAHRGYRLGSDERDHRSRRQLWRKPVRNWTASRYRIRTICIFRAQAAGRFSLLRAEFIQDVSFMAGAFPAEIRVTRHRRSWTSR